MRMKNLFLLAITLAVAVLTIQVVLVKAENDDSIDIDIVTESKSFRNKGRIRYWYRKEQQEDAAGAAHAASKTNAPACASWLVLGVGTAMSVNEYKKIAQALLQHNPDLVVLFVDHNPHVAVKFVSAQYKALVNYVYEHASEILAGVCKEPPKNVFIGGHSASGRAAILKGGYDFSPAGFVGLDPWWICPEKGAASGGLVSSVLCANNGPSPVIDKALPSLFFGFTVMTCGVDPTIAALGAYNRTGPDHRVLYQIHNPSSTSINHCSFTDGGCPGAYFWGKPWGCPMMQVGAYDFVYQLVGKGFQRFATAVRDRSLFHRRHFDLGSQHNNVTLLVTGDLASLIAS